MNRSPKSRFILCVVLARAVRLPVPAHAQTKVVGFIDSVQGHATVTRHSATEAVKVRDMISLGEQITTADGSTVQLSPIGGPLTLVTLRERTTLTIDQTPRRTIFRLSEGGLVFTGGSPWQEGLRDTVEIRTPHAITQARGAALAVEIRPPLETTRVCVFSGTAVVSGLSEDVGQTEVGVGHCVTIGVTGAAPP